MNEDEDLELQALQRQLDDAFQTTRPRAGFEDDLWLRMQARKPLWHRLRDVAAGLVAAVREVPKVPAATVAVVLVLAIGVGILSLSGFHLGGGAGSTATTAARPESGSGQYNAEPGAFGRLPVPAATSELPRASNPASAGPGPLSADSYVGPVNLVWAGQVQLPPVRSAPVYRYAEPSAADADQFASSLGARPQGGQAGVGILGVYFGASFTLEVISSNHFPIREPFYAVLLSPSKPAGAGPTPTEIANAVLGAHSLVPAWPFMVAVSQSGDATRVTYMRQFATPGYGLAYLVDAFGERYGIEVDIRGGQPFQASGPLPLTLDAATYPIISGDEAAHAAVALAPPARVSAEPIPTVRLTSVELVYALAIGGDHGYYEPAYLFSGTFSHNGITYVKRVLVPAIDPSQRLP